MGTRWPLHHALDLVGGKWKLIALMRIKDGVSRFAALRASLPGISDKQLTLCLRQLERDALITRRITRTRPLEHDYIVTELGAALQPVADALYRFGELHLDASKR